MSDLKVQVIKAIRSHNPAAAVLVNKKFEQEVRDLSTVKGQSYFWRRELIAIQGTMIIRSSIDDSLDAGEWVYLFKRDIARFVATTWYKHITKR